MVANKYKVIAHCYCIMGRGHLNVLKLGCLGEETVIISVRTIPRALGEPTFF